MRRAGRFAIEALAILLLILFAPGFSTDAAAESTDAGLPTGVAYPIHVRLSVRVLDVTRLTETQSSIGATVEFTQRWTDPGLRFDRIALGAEHLDFVGAKAEAELARMWSPDVLLDLLGWADRADSSSGRGLPRNLEDEQFSLR